MVNLVLLLPMINIFIICPLFLFPVWVFTFLLFSGGVHTNDRSLNLQNLPPGWALAGSGMWSQTAA